ncbi:hypothetical protein NDU88_001567 [Pleurodeles waltl]|uniref:Uncharacterized protein n=1 Tax=Pleurodeles waltl TaxID=8319 RepID=A0AAV7Q7I8_PLEWA|nr:hypothetical protein NDU88_001567 [Pleurodeles waltl]
MRTAMTQAGELIEALGLHSSWAEQQEEVSASDYSVARCYSHSAATHNTYHAPNRAGTPVILSRGMLSISC